MRDRLRIAVVAACPLPWPRGTPIRIHRLSEALALRGHDVHMVTYHLGERDQAPYSIHRIRPVPFYRRHAPGPTVGKSLVLNPLLYGKLRQVLRAREFDVIHAHHYEALLVALLARKGATPLLYDAHTTLAGELATYRLPLPNRLLVALGRSIDAYLPPRADHVIAVTDRIRSRLIEEGGLGPERVVTIGNGIRADRFPVTNRQLDSSPTIVYGGNLAPYQRIDLLIAAFESARAKRPDLILLIATDEDPEPIYRMAEGKGVRKSVFVERSEGGDRLPHLFARAWVAVTPRVQCDGVPQKNLNYMAAGLPVVAFAESAAPTVHGETGLVVSGEDPVALGESIVSLVEQPDVCRRMGERGREKIRREMSWDVRAAQVEEVYARLLGSSRAPSSAG